MKAVVIIPTFDHGRLIQYAIESVLRQTHTDFEIFVIGDGAGAETDQLMEYYQKQDPRVRYFKYPKGPRLGEAYRHSLLLSAKADFVAYLADDDLYLENHLATLAAELEQVDFTNVLPVKILPSGKPFVWQLDLNQTWYRELLLGGTNRMPLGAVGHRLDFYRRLPHGWRTTPEGKPTDLHMWQQFLEQSDLRCSSLTTPGILHFASLDRKTMDLETRAEELQKYSRLIQDSGALEALKAEILQARLEAGPAFEMQTGERLQDFRTGLAYRNNKYKTETEALRQLVSKRDSTIEALQLKVQELDALKQILNKRAQHIEALEIKLQEVTALKELLTKRNAHIEALELKTQGLPALQQLLAKRNSTIEALQSELDKFEQQFQMLEEFAMTTGRRSASLRVRDS